jgi:DNA-binding transcriptional MerR regulator
MVDDEREQQPQQKPAPVTRIRGGGGWRAWLPEGQPEPTKLVTRAELLAKLKERGLLVTERELRYWESTGALPEPIRQFRGPGTYALYPWWHHSIVLQVPTLRGQGLSWEEIGQHLRADFATEAERTLRGEWSPTGEPAMPPALIAEIHRFLTKISRDRGSVLTIGDLRITPQDGGETYRYVFFGNPDDAEP